MGKKRGGQSHAPEVIKIEVKAESDLDSNVLVARDRFQGALREILHHSDTSSADSDDDIPLNEYKITPKKTDQGMYRPKQVQTRKLKRRRQVPMDSAFHHTYVMKLFDRSVDLAQFQEDTPLYPICRAWMANQPRNPHLIPKARSPSPEVSAEESVVDSSNLFDTTGEIQDVGCLPPPLPSQEAFPRNRIPSPVEMEKEELNLDYEGQTLKSKEALLKEHREHWGAVRRKWHQQAHKNEQRFAESADILATIFKRAQSEFD